MAVLSGLILQHPAQLLHGFPGVDHPGGVVGGVDDDRLGIGAQGLLEGGEVDLKILDIGGDGDELAAGALHEDLVLGEVGGEGDELVPLTAHGRQAAAQGGRRPHGEVETVLVIGCAKTAVQILGQGLAHIRRALGGGVAVEGHRIDLVHQPVDGFRHGRGRGDAGVADGEIVHVLGTHHGGPGLGEGEGLPDLGPGGPQGHHALG